jgi:hypothetical protein
MDDACPVVKQSFYYLGLEPVFPARNFYCGLEKEKRGKENREEPIM